jgi:hypothetical protein
LPPATTWENVQKSLILFIFINLLCIFVAKQRCFSLEAFVGGGSALNTNKGFKL